MLSEKTKIVKVADAAVSAGTDVTSSEVDMSGWGGVVFFGTVATVNAANFAKVQQDTAAGMAAAADLLGTKTVPGTNANSFCIDVYRPLERYVRCVVDRGGANTATGDIYAIMYDPSLADGSQGSTIDIERHASPAEGAA